MSKIKLKRKKSDQYTQKQKQKKVAKSDQDIGSQFLTSGKQCTKTILLSFEDSQ